MASKIKKMINAQVSTLPSLIGSFPISLAIGG